MLLNYLKLSLRLLVRNPFFTFINVLGLSVGFAVFFILWQYSQNELKSDQFHKDFNRIVKAGFIHRWTDDNVNWDQATYGAFHGGVARNIVNDYKEIEGFTKIFNQGNFRSNAYAHGDDLLLTYINKKNERVSFLEHHIAYADPNLFTFFSIPLIRGNPKTVLSNINGAVVSETTAKKYFGQDNPVGKIMLIDDSIPLHITGVFKDLPQNSHLNFSLVISSIGIEKATEVLAISSPMPHVYFKLISGASISDFQKKLQQQDEKYWGWVRGTSGKTTTSTFLQPLQEVAFSNYSFDQFVPKSKYFLTVLRIVALLILGMGWINYINLTLSANQKRIKELAARKSVGARSSDFIRQFLAESFVINAISLLAALTLVQLVRYPAQLLFEFYLPDWNEISFSTGLILGGIFFSGVVFTGFYPAWITLSKNPSFLFGASKKKTRGNLFTTGLTTLQYSIAIVLIVFIYSIYRQLNFIFEKNIGLDTQRVIVMDLPWVRNDQFETSLNYFLQQVDTQSGIEGYTLSNSLTGDQSIDEISIRNNADSTQRWGMDSNGGVDERFIPFYGIQLLAGRNFIADDPSNENAIILSRNATRRMGFASPEDALGFEIRRPRARIIGVVEDYDLKPLLSRYTNEIDGVRGIALMYKDAFGWDVEKVSIRLRAGAGGETIKNIEDAYREIFPNAILNWSFLDDRINNQYNSEKTALNQTLLFTVIAIGIACLGLLGSITNKVVEKTKEIGIRKVMGAKMIQIAHVLLGTSVWQLLIATAIGLPVAGYLITEYLQKFSERIDLTWWNFALPVVLLTVIMFVTIASVLAKAANTNPVDSLRYE